MKMTNTTRKRGKDRVKGQPNRRATKAELIEIAIYIARAKYEEQWNMPVLGAFDKYCADKALEDDEITERWKDFYLCGQLSGVSVLRRVKQDYFENGVKVFSIS